MDWTVMVLAFIALIAIGRGLRWGWMSSALSYFVWAFDTYQAGRWGYVVAGLVLGGIAIFNLVRPPKKR